jgi:Concanavalin A-like lectin/glucanases superfamily
MRTLFFFILLTCLSSCSKFDWHNPYDPECPKELFTPSSPGASMEGNSVKLTWSQQNDDISGFALFRSAEGESISNLTQTQKSTTQYIDANFTPGKKYTYYVVAVAGTNKSDTVKAEITPVIPVTISTGAITELSTTSAKVEGNVTNTGGGTVTSRGVCWSTTPSPTVNNSKTTEGTGAGQFTSTLTNLLAGTTYYARAYGENSRGVSYGTQVTFTTLGPPKLTTNAVINITATTATCGGTIITDGGTQITAKGVVWNTSPNPTVDLPTKTNDGVGINGYTSQINGLKTSTIYYVRAYAENAQGVSYGTQITFTTNGPPPSQTISEGLFAYFPFNGNANDESGNGKNGIVSGALNSSDRFGIANQSYYFNGTNSYISISQSILPNSPTNYTISLWCKLNDLNTIKTYNDLICDRSQLNYDFKYRIGIFKNNLNETFYGSSINGNNIDGSVFSKQVVSLNWVHLVSVVDVFNNNIKLYINGTQVVSLNKASYPSHLNSTFIGVSKFPSGFEGFFNGYIDDIRIYNRLLNQEEITYLANN